MEMTLDTFVDLSVVLTGYDKTVLKPQFDTQKVAEEYYATLIKEADPQELALLNTAFLGMPNTDPATVQSTIMDDSQISTLAMIIIRMWYTAVWYTDNSANDGFVVSSKAYTNGLVWKTMSAHPMGYSEFNFGYWETAPAEEQ